MKRKVYLASLPNGYFGSAKNSWGTLSVERLASSFPTDVYDINFISITDIPEIEFNSDDTLIYTSLYNNEVRSYLKDILYYVKDQCLIIPSYEVLLAHENKGFQEVMRSQFNNVDFSGQYVFDLDQIKIPVPFVLKTVDGSGSSGVQLIKTAKDLATVKKNANQLPLKRAMKKIIRSKQLSTESYSLYSYFYKPFKRFVAQPFLEKLNCDYRVLVIEQRFYAMRRDVRKGDFRASGSKKFHHNKVPSELLDYAKEIFEELDNPFISMDLALKDGKPYLIEFQGTNFGSSVIRRSVGYYCKTNEGWEFLEKESLHEETLSYGLLSYVERKNA
ncbi:hypothetical protein [Psychrobacter sp. S1-30-MNA-CIBAN-0213]|uniref:ATP-grasp domain-containing protein n=1 Tax=unclassified Psychrobacter TaxID=196806 RepID=UPI003316AE2C